jgi:hypothetical protein
MRLEQHSATVFALRHPFRGKAFTGQGHARSEIGRFANLALMLIVMTLAALWLAFPPAQLSSSPPARAMLAQDPPDAPR